jgi:Domain of unknown function (DUF4476)
MLLLYKPVIKYLAKKNQEHLKCTIMKEISTLAFGFLFSVASFANYAPNRLTVLAEGNNNIKVTVDGSRFDQQSFSNSVVFENLQPGFHSVKVYQLEEKRRGLFGRSYGTEFRLVYTASVNIKPLFATTIELNRYGRAQVNEVPLRGAFDNRGWDKKDGRGNDRDRRDDRDYRDNDRDRNNTGYGNNNGYGNSSYGRSISDEDFFAAQRVMERENFDNARLLYAKRVADENWLCAEQVKSLARFFSFDNSRMEFVKYAYSKTTDKGNFSVVCNAFDSNYSKDQLMNFIKSCR